VQPRTLNVTLLCHEEGVSASCPDLPGCHSQGEDVASALRNIGEAITDYLDLYAQPKPTKPRREAVAAR